ncbi:hypothetical protein [Planomonospora venezuelensis]|uniref:Uncharacterized protein n=1 Tax=Planomonospora venezuelensis TaxID=1999 RepID=A0A841CXN8_PLAVE|nr:hypothetical protein [Planomonospora venezuelensis]MBB5960888.1 hypothetical protein [Planomonospora venezuelensis]GIN01122.1 hypothetical protein Pve01_27800 [Planomonospora venezuelensis]
MSLMTMDRECPQRSLVLAEERQAALADRIARAFPAWTIWWNAGIWYATGPCSQSGCGCRRTLHAPTADGLREQLAAGEE